MPQTVQVGSILVKESLMPELLGLEIEGLKIERHSGDWNLIQTLDGFALDRKIHDAGWNFFFMAGEVKAMFFGAIGTKKIENALRRIFGKLKQQPFNALEVTGLLRKRFLGVPYTVVSAHSRHVQQSCYLHEQKQRCTNEEKDRWSSQVATSNRLALERELRFRIAVVS
ncbi:MAG TPA: hypothetical protein VFA90_09975 [Terriglobales bacterium]|nr:hypothetical protein [Terriglobales bacterium]